MPRFSTLPHPQRWHTYTAAKRTYVNKRVHFTFVRRIERNLRKKIQTLFMNFITDKAFYPNPNMWLPLELFGKLEAPIIINIIIADHWNEIKNRKWDPVSISWPCANTHASMHTHRELFLYLTDDDPAIDYQPNAKIFINLSKL